MQHPLWLLFCWRTSWPPDKLLFVGMPEGVGQHSTLPMAGWAQLEQLLQPRLHTGLVSTCVPAVPRAGICVPSSLAIAPLPVIADDVPSRLQVLQALTRKFRLAPDVDLAAVAGLCAPRQALLRV